MGRDGDVSWSTRRREGRRPATVGPPIDPRMTRSLTQACGIITSMNTPFDAQGQIDHDALRRELELVSASGCVGVLAFAVAGEGSYLTLSEFDEAVHTVTHAALDLPTLISVSAATQAERIQRAKIARHHGADGALVQSPIARDAAERAELVFQVAESGPEVLALQDLDFAGAGLSIADITALVADIDQLQMLKIETAPSGPKLTALRQELGPEVHLSGGWTVLQMVDALDRSIDAFVPTELEEAYVAIDRLHRSGDRSQARRLWERLLPILAFSNQHIGVSVRLFKEFRVARGVFSSNICRAPIPPLDPWQHEEARLLWHRYAELLTELS